MKDQLAALLRGLGNVTVDSATPAFAASSEHIAYGSVSKANAEAVSKFKHPSLKFYFDNVGDGTFKFHVYFTPSDLNTAAASTASDKLNTK